MIRNEKEKKKRKGKENEIKVRVNRPQAFRENLLSAKTKIPATALDNSQPPDRLTRFSVFGGRFSKCQVKV